MTDPFPTRGGGDALDRLLDLAPMQEPGPWFATRTLARCLSGRDAAETVPFRWNALFTRWALAGAFALFLTGLGLQQAHRIHTLETHRQQRVQEAFEVMASLGGDESDASTQDNSL
jgi:hypothetical protein